MRAPRICPDPKCPLIADECPNPAHKPGGWVPDRVRGTREERGYGKTYETDRRRTLRAEPICYICQTNPSIEVDHKIPLSEGGSRTGSNLRGVCGPCHRVKTQREAARGRRRATEVEVDHGVEGGVVPLRGAVRPDRKSVV